MEPIIDGLESVKIRWISKEFDIIFCSLIEADANDLPESEIFTFESLPCLPLTSDEIKIINDESPTEEWGIEGIKSWFIYQEIELPESEDKDELLILVKEIEEGGVGEEI